MPFEEKNCDCGGIVLTACAKRNVSNSTETNNLRVVSVGGKLRRPDLSDEKRANLR